LYIANYDYVLIHKCVKFSHKLRPPCEFSSGSQSHLPLKIRHCDNKSGVAATACPTRSRYGILNPAVSSLNYLQLQGKSLALKVMPLSLGAVF